MKPAGERGAVLVHALVMIALLGFMFSLWLKTGLGRHVMAAKSVKGQANIHRLAGVENLVYACLAGTRVGRGTCDPGAASACFPTRYDGRTVAVTLTGSAPNCRLEIEIED